MISIEFFYHIAGFMFLSFGIFSLLNTRKKPMNRILGGIFWMAYSFIFLFAGLFSNFIMGLIVILLAIIAGSGGLKIREKGIDENCKCKEQGAKRYGYWLFIPALLVPLITLVGTFILPYMSVFENKNATLNSLAIGCIIAFIVALISFRASAKYALADASKTMDTIGWAALLPQILATLGIIFASTSMGEQVSKLLSIYIALDNAFIAVSLYCAGMALFTIVMGNAFAAFPVLTAGVALPVLILQMHANPAIVGAIGMLSGFCGTLMTPMAANFNIVPAALLNLDDKNGVIKAQFMTGMLLLIVNILLMYFLAFKF